MPTTGAGAATVASHALEREQVRFRMSPPQVTKIDEHLPLLDLGAEGLQIGEAGRLHRLAGGHMKRAEVQAALDHLAFQEAVAEIGGGMSAVRFGRIEGAVDIVDGHELIADLEAPDAAGGQLGDGANGDRIL